MPEALRLAKEMAGVLGTGSLLLRCLPYCQTLEIMMHPTPRIAIAIIGAGITGLTIARELADYADITVFEKARGVGGRMSTRYAAPFMFDHGTQYFTARNKQFQEFLAPFRQAGVVVPWEGKVVSIHKDKKTTKRLWFEEHWVASPNMNSLCRELALGCHLRVATEVVPLSAKTAKGWELYDTSGGSLGFFDWVISTAPPEQTMRLFAAHGIKKSSIANTRLQGCYALMLGFNRKWDKTWSAATLSDSPLSWLSVNSSKPGRDSEYTCLVAHTCNDWAEAHIDDEMSEVQAALLMELKELTGIEGETAEYCTTHRWRYATKGDMPTCDPWLDGENQLSAVGDWCTHSRIEDAWLASMQLVSELKKYLK